MKDMNRQAWVDHIFQLEVPVGWALNVLTRAEDTGIRLEHHARNLSDIDLSFKPDGKWSIKEHIGHLIDLEDLHFVRLKELDQLKTTLSGADMSNAKTNSAKHNSTDIEDLLTLFNKKRSKFLHAFESLTETSKNHASLHPRLKVMMKPVDLLYFMAEHDDHHVATILEIKHHLDHQS